MERKVYRVSQVNRYVKTILSQDPILSGLWITGEISNCKKHSSGHLYFTLKDSEGAISAVMFASDTRNLRFRPSEGMKVEVQGSISLYEKTGQYQLYVRRMEQAGEGALYQAFVAMRDRLEKEGLFDPAHKKPIPQYAFRIGIITSPTGAAVRDMIQIARRRYPGVQLILCPVLVQGMNAATSIADGIRRMNRESDADVLIVGRGGGSIEDLWAFNEEETARAIYESRIPVVSAVGHETDFTIADFVADLRAPTPSAAAELTVPQASELILELSGYEQRLMRTLYTTLEHKRQRLQYLEHAGFRTVPLRLNQYRQQLDLLNQRLEDRGEGYMKHLRHRLEMLTERIHLLDPERPLGKGYSILVGETGVIDSIHKAKPDTWITAQLSDGSLQLHYEKEKTL